MDVVVLDYLRTPIGKYLGSLKEYEAYQLGSIVIENLAYRKNVEKIVEKVIMGNVISAGLGQNPARQAAVLGLKRNDTDSITVNKVCGSSLEAIVLASQSIKSKDNNLVIAGGMESMSNAPFLIKNRSFRERYKMGELNSAKLKIYNVDYLELLDAMIYDGLLNCECYGKEYNLHMGTLADKWVEMFNIDEYSINKFAYESHLKAANSDFSKEIIKVGNLEKDECIRKDTSIEKISNLPKVFGKYLNAGNSSQLSDGAAALLISSKNYAKKIGIEPKFKIIGYSSYHHEPHLYGTAPAYAIINLLKKTKTKITDYQAIEINEAFSVQVLIVIKILEEKLNYNIYDKVNQKGGAIALGHPIGASGARISVTLLNLMEEKGYDKGIATACLGGGGAVAMAFERI